MNNEVTNNKRIAKNTLLLYGRMMFTMWISLYTSRMVLDILGVIDFGIYNVVGGIIALMWALNGALSTSTTRHITFELGADNQDKLKQVFSTSLTIHGLISIFILLICETIGLWFMCTQITIPVERIEAAHWVYQFALLYMVLNVMSVPFNACIIAHEKMDAYAYISIIDIVLKLVIVYILKWVPYDKLKLYSLLYFFTQIVVQAIYMIYCKYKFPEVRLAFIWNKELLKHMASFAGWNLIGSGSALVMSQGHSIILNQFFGPVVNAAKGVTNQVLGMVGKFSGNFQMALNPQIFKSYASQNLEYMHKLIFASSKYSFYMLFLLSLPIAIESETLLSTWLKIVPQNTSQFLRIVLLTATVNTLASPLVIAAQATGIIKKFQTAESIVLLLILPFTYITLRFGADVIMAFYIYLLFHIIAIVVRLVLLHSSINISYKDYTQRVIKPILYVSTVSTTSGILFYHYLHTNTFVNSIMICALILGTTFSTIYLLGLNQAEKLFIKTKMTEITIKTKNICRRYLL